MSRTFFARRRSLAATSVAALATTGLLASTGVAGAAVTGSPGADAQGRPDSFRDDVNGVAVVLCTDAVNCEPADTGPDADPLHGGYFSAEAAAGPFRIVFGIETAAGETADEQPDPDNAIVSNVARYNGRNLQPGGRYLIKHPWGQRVVVADNRGRADVVVEAGGEAGTPIANGTVKSFLRRLNAPAGFLGDLETAGPVMGSPTGFNRVQVTGPGVNVTQRNFIVNGQLVQNRPMTMLNRNGVRLGAKRKRTPSTTSVRVTSFGTAGAPVRTAVFGRNKSRFAVNSSACATVPAGSACNITVRYTPAPNRDATATLVVRDGNVIRHLPLTGIGFRTR